MKDFLRKKHGLILVPLFLLIIVWWASEAEAETIFEIGPSQVAENFSTGAIFTITERFKDRYDITGGYITPQRVSFCDRPDCYWKIREQIFAGVEVNFDDPWGAGIKFGLGPYIFQNPDRVAPTRFRWGLRVEWRINRRFGLSARHWSTAGSGPVGCFYRVHDDPSSGEMCNDWNTGQDSWLRLVYYTR